jgi:hypothetical protein
MAPPLKIVSTNPSHKCILLTTPPVEEGLMPALAKWVSLEVRLNLDALLEVARGAMNGFNLSSSHTEQSNLHNFLEATNMSSYLHLYASAGGQAFKVTVFKLLTPFSHLISIL